MYQELVQWRFPYSESETKDQEGCLIMGFVSGDDEADVADE